MMLIYPSQNDLCAAVKERTMGLSADTNSVVAKHTTNAYCEEKSHHAEEMHTNQNKEYPAKTLEQIHCPHIWNYDEFSFELIGEGFFGNVYKVTHKISGQVLVLKELKNSTDEEHKTMFTEEIKTMHRLCHPNVLKCEGLALHGESLCLLTEYITGGSLDELLIKRSPLLSTWESRLSVALEIARGMHYLHSQGVIHRDLASKNILVRQKENGRLQAIVADLGLSNTVKGLALSEEQYFFETVGSPYHMAPEVLNEKPYNMKADVFSYGIILCEIITMCPGADPDDVPRTDDFGLAVENFSEMASDCPSKLLDLTIRCCQVDPKERPSFDKIVKALDIMLDKFVESDDEILNGDATNMDYVIDESLLCTCGSIENKVNEDILGVEQFKDRFGSVRKRASRRVLKMRLQRCPRCGGRVWKSQEIDKTEDDRNEYSVVKNEVTEECKASAVKEQEFLPSPKEQFTAGDLLNESQDALELSKLVDNTPGKLPKFFKNLLKSKRHKIKPKDVKRRWRKSFHDIFASTPTPNDSGQKSEDGGVDNGCREEMTSPTASLTNGRGKSPTRSHDKRDCNEKCDKQEKYEKQEKPRKLSKFRRKSENKSYVESRKIFTDYNDSIPSVSSGSSPRVVDAEENNTESAHANTNELVTTSSPSISLHHTDNSLSKKLAVSIDSLDKLGISDERCTVKSRDRRYSMPSRKARHGHGRTQSVESPHLPHPPLQKKTSSSSKLLNFLRKKSLGSPRDQT